jgi:hypothetical protein
MLMFERLGFSPEILEQSSCSLKPKFSDFAADPVDRLSEFP